MNFNFSSLTDHLAKKDYICIASSEIYCLSRAYAVFPPGELAKFVVLLAQVIARFKRAFFTI